jgi:anti-sigma B factor antagonist
MSSQPSPSDILRINVSRHGDMAVVRLVGSANMDMSSNLQDRLIEVIESPVRRLIIDLSGLSFVSSVGLGAIIAAHLHCRHHSCEVHLVAPQPKILELLELTRLTRLFAIHESVEQALAGD